MFCHTKPNVTQTNFHKLHPKLHPLCAVLASFSVTVFDLLDRAVTLGVGIP